MAETVGYEAGKHNQVSAIVDHVLFTKTLPEAWWQWSLEQALWYLRELKLDVSGDVKTVLLPVTDRKTVILPDDYVDWVAVAVKVGQYFVTLGVNDKLNELDRVPNSTDYVNGLLSQNLPNGLNFNSYGGYMFFNYSGTSVNCLGGGFVAKGSFKFKQTGTTKELLLDYDYPHDNLLVMHITDGFEPCGQTVVDPYLADYVKKSIEFAWEENKEPSRTEASIYRRGMALNDARKLVRARKNDLDPQTLLNIARQQTRFTPKI